MTTPETLTATDSLLFALPQPTKRTRKPFVKTQRWVCKRCKDGHHDGSEYIYCDKHDLCLESYHDGVVVLTNGGIPIKCDGGKYKETSWGKVYA